MSEPQPPEDAPPATAGAPSRDDRNLAVLAHLLGILTSFLGALVVWLIKKETSPYLDQQGREALNFQVTILLAHAVGGLTVPIGIGCFILPVVMILNIFFCVLAAVAASRGENYRYPIALRLVS
ncbi:MAG: DUF4870 domain-containing protein [Planctomycetota bacterium]|jgi:uncharacterized Tic20 family protein